MNSKFLKLLRSIEFNLDHHMRLSQAQDVLRLTVFRFVATFLTSRDNKSLIFDLMRKTLPTVFIDLCGNGPED